MAHTNVIALRLGTQQVMNSFVATQLIAALSYFAFWMPAGDNLGMLYAFSAVYGIVWGSFWSNLAASVAILFSHLDVFPVVIGTAYFGASLAFFANAPVFGALVDLGKADGKGYRYAQAWAGGIYLAGVFCLAIVRFWTAGWKLRAKV